MFNASSIPLLLYCDVDVIADDVISMGGDDAITEPMFTRERTSFCFQLSQSLGISDRVHNGVGVTGLVPNHFCVAHILSFHSFRALLPVFLDLVWL